MHQLATLFFLNEKCLCVRERESVCQRERNIYLKGISLVAWRAALAVRIYHCHGVTHLCAKASRVGGGHENTIETDKTDRPSWKVNTNMDIDVGKVSVGEGPPGEDFYPKRRGRAWWQSAACLVMTCTLFNKHYELNWDMLGMDDASLQSSP